MAILIARISYFGKQGEDSEYIITDWTRLTIKRGLDATSNTVDVTLKNSIKKLLSDGSVLHKYVNDSKVLCIDGTNELQQGDVIKIWLKWCDSASDIITYDDNSSNLITISEVQEWSGTLEDNKTDLVLKCVDKTFIVLNKLWVQAYTYSKGLTCPTMAQNIIRNSTDGIKSTVSGYNDFGGFTKPATYEIDARLMSGTYTQQASLDVVATGSPYPAYIESKRIDNSVYPPIAMTKVWKPVFEWLKEINDIRNTNSAVEVSGGNPVQDRNNRFYVDQKNRYHQFYPSDSVNYEITAGTVDPDGTVTSSKMTKKTFDIINVVIFNAGKDLDNVGILWYYFDRTSKERRLKMKYIPMLEIASEGNGSLRQAEVTLGNISVANTGVVTILVSSGTTSWGQTYTTAADYKEKFRTYAKTTGELRARALTIGRGNPRWKGDITVKKGAYYVPGQLLKYAQLTHGINEELLRIVDVTHQISPTQWVSTLDLEVDEPKYGETV